jgi:hypothetical protein
MRLRTDNAEHEIRVTPNVSAPVSVTPILHETGEQIGQIVVSAVHNSHESSPRQFFSWLERRNLWVIDDIIAVEFGDISVLSPL